VAAKHQGLARPIRLPHPRCLVLGRGDDALAVGASPIRLWTSRFRPKKRAASASWNADRPAKGLSPSRSSCAFRPGKSGSRGCAPAQSS
jgi:hypothetical protein